MYNADGKLHMLLPALTLCTEGMLFQLSTCPLYTLGTHMMHQCNPLSPQLPCTMSAKLCTGQCAANNASQWTHWRFQGHLWQWYLEPSLYGTEIVTLGGSRGPSISYYVPYLSAMQLLLPLPPAAHTPSMQQQQQPAGRSSASPPADQPAQASFSQQQPSAPRSSSQQWHGGDAAPQAQQGISQQRPAVLHLASAGGKPSRVYQVENDGQVCFEQSVLLDKFALCSAPATVLATQLVACCLRMGAGVQSLLVAERLHACMALHDLRNQTSLSRPTSA